VSNLRPIDIPRFLQRGGREGRRRPLAVPDNPNQGAAMNAVESSPPVAQTPASDEIEGLAWGYRFTEAGDAQLLQGAALREALEKQESWLWLNFDLDDERASVAIASLPHLPPDAVAMLLTKDDRQHIESFGQIIGGVVADYERGDSLDVRRIVRWQFVMAPHLFVSARRRPGHTLHQLRLDLQSGRRFPDVLRLFDAIIHEFTSATSLLLHDLTNKLDAMEEQLLDQKEVGYDTLGLVRRRLVRLHRQAAPLRAVLIHMLTERPAWFTDQAAADCQRVAARMDSLAGDLESLQERARALQDELKARDGEKTNKRLTVLSIVSALLLPPTLITGIFGMNVDGLPFRETPEGFLVTCGLMVVSAAGMMVVLRRIRLL
jgi:zinc transporter